MRPAAAPLIAAALLAAGFLAAWAGPSPDGTPAAGRENLVPNGDFDEGGKGATKIPGWTEVDGLTSFFSKEPGRGRVLLLDTDVNLSEANARWKEMELPPEKRPPAREKGPTKPPKYDTVGGTTGAKIYSDYFRVEPGMRYRLRVDVKSDRPTVKIFVKGYARFQGGFRKFYQAYKNIEHREPGWHTYERTFNPTLHSPKVTHIRIMPYAYWPPGKAWVDRVEVVRIGRERPPAAASEKSLLANGSFESDSLSPWTASGAVKRVRNESDGTFVRLSPGGTLTGPLVKVEEDQEYVLRARVRPEGAVLRATVEGLLRFGGKWTALYEKEETVPPAGEGWIDFEMRLHPTRDTPQVSRVRVRFALVGDRGRALLDDVVLEPAAPAGKRSGDDG